jgi:hypothetical protein
VGQGCWASALACCSPLCLTLNAAAVCFAAAACICCYCSCCVASTAAIVARALQIDDSLLSAFWLLLLPAAAAVALHAGGANFDRSVSVLKFRCGDESFPIFLSFSPPMTTYLEPTWPLLLQTLLQPVGRRRGEEVLTSPTRFSPPSIPISPHLNSEHAEPTCNWGTTPRPCVQEAPCVVHRATPGGVGCGFDRSRRPMRRLRLRRSPLFRRRGQFSTSFVHTGKADTSAKKRVTKKMIAALMLILHLSRVVSWCVLFDLFVLRCTWFCATLGQRPEAPTTRGSR